MGTESGYETTDARAKPILLVTAALGVLCLVGLGAALVVVEVSGARANRGHEAPSPLFERPLPEEAPLLTDEPGYAKKILAEQKARASSYGWVDRNQKRVHVPIDRAVQMYLKTQTSSGSVP